MSLSIRFPNKNCIYEGVLISPKSDQDGNKLQRSNQGTGGSLTGPDPENRVSDQDTGSPGRPVSSGLQVPGEPGHCRARR